MFGLKTSTAAPLTRPVPHADRPEAIPRFDEYLALAAELGVASLERGQVLQRVVADFLWENNIEMYSYKQVCAYMSAIADKEKKLFCWRPLRDRDIPSETMSGGGWRWGADDKHDHYSCHLWRCRTYDKPVPFEVLKNVKLLEDKFPGKLHFFVTDYDVADPDPFICLGARDMSRIIFGAWDEPAFFASK